MKQLLKKDQIRILIITLVILVLAALTEWIYLGAIRSDLEYERLEFSDELFSGNEVKLLNDGSYEMLANNSCFELSLPEAQPVISMQIYFERGMEDTTDSVLYFKGVKNGVHGEFPSAMTKRENGVYYALLEAESVEYIRIYPTGIVHSVIPFKGVCLNPDIVEPRYSFSRIILWVFLITWLYLMYNLIAASLDRYKLKIKLPYQLPSLWWAIYIIMGAMVLLVAFQATHVFTGVVGAESVLLPVAISLFSFFYAAVWLLVKKLKKVEVKLGVVVFLVGILFCFSNAPLQTPDEYAHYLRAYTVSQGRLDFDIGYEYPDEVYHLMDSFPAWFNSSVVQTGNGNVLSSVRSYLERVNTPYPEWGAKHNTSIQLIFPYIPSAIAMLLVRLVGGGPLAELYAARIANVLVFAFCSWYAMKKAKRLRGGLMTFICLPMTLYMAASVSYDSIFLSACVVFFGLVLAEEFTTKDLILASVAFSVMICIKPPYLAMILLVLLMPKESFKFPKGQLRTIAVVTLSALLSYGLFDMLYPYWFARNIPPVPSLSGVNPSAQLLYVLSNPVRFLLILIVDTYINVAYLPLLGLFGWLDVNAVLTGFLSPLLIMMVAALYADTMRSVSNREKISLTSGTLLTYATIVTGFYLVSSTLGSNTIMGVQARYFLPLIPCLVALISWGLSPILRFRDAVKNRDILRDNTAIYICAAVAFIGALELAVINFLK